MREGSHLPIFAKRTVRAVVPAPTRSSTSTSANQPRSEHVCWHSCRHSIFVRVGLSRCCGVRVYNASTMRKTQAGVVGIILVFAILLLQSIERWSILDSVIAALRRMGPAGIVMVNVLLSPVLPLVIAIAALYLVYEGRKAQKEPAIPPSTQPIDNRANQAQSTGAVTQQVFVGGAPKILPPQPPPEPKPKPNMRCLGPLTTRLRMGMDGHGFYEDAEKRFGESLSAAMICFRNEASAGRQVKLVYNARASIVFMDDSGQEMGIGIAEACWLGALRNIDFPLEQTQCAIVAILLPDGTFTCPYVRRTHAHWGEGLPTEIQRLDACPKKIEVRLIKENELLLEPCIFDLSVVEGQPVLKQRPAPSR
jgi:hypothetical protein